jgi:carbon-monoxide dehydrogenase medium subunit
LKRLREFEYFEPASLDEAVQLLSAAGDSAQVLAGGTDLIVDMKMGRMRPSTVVNLKRIPGLGGINDDEGGTRIGALTKVPAIEASRLVQERHPALAQAASILASPPVRALATIGGNVGRASPASDLGPALIVHDARAAIVGADGSRDELVEDLYVGPGATSLIPSDIITHFTLPKPLPGFGSAHVKLGKRGSGTDIALAGVSASVVVGNNGEILDCRIALASLGPTPFRAFATESLLRSEPPTEALLAAAAEMASGEAKPIGDMRASASYRTRLARVLTLRALREALESARVGVVV